MTDTGTVRYTVIGTGSTLMHVSVGVLLIRAGSDPHFANVGAFLFAFCISFAGHHFYSFRGHKRPMKWSLFCFTCAAMVGFGVNEAVLLGLLRSDPFL